MCRNSEIIKSQLQKLGNDRESVNYTRKSKKGKPSSKHLKTENEEFGQKAPFQTCKYCGGKHKLDRNRCPAYGQIFNSCKKINHFAKVCQQPRDLAK